MKEADVIKFYREQLRKFDKIGVGNKTENNTIITELLIEVTRRRLGELITAKINPMKGYSQNGVK